MIYFNTVSSDLASIEKHVSIQRLLLSFSFFACDVHQITLYKMLCGEFISYPILIKKFLNQSSHLLVSLENIPKSEPKHCINVA